MPSLGNARRIKLSLGLASQDLAVPTRIRKRDPGRRDPGDPSGAQRPSHLRSAESKQKWKYLTRHLEKEMNGPRSFDLVW
jgi:hypothetical protein